jgi:hypothetical protein
MLRIWKRFLDRYGVTYCVARIGDDFGFKTSLLMRPETYRDHILPQYVPIIELAHRYRKPFLLHSCGEIWEIMEDIIERCGIDTKHSNEDSIAPFSVGLDQYGTKIGNFGGIDMNVLCTQDESGIVEYVRDVVRVASGYPGVASTLEQHGFALFGRDWDSRISPISKLHSPCLTEPIVGLRSGYLVAISIMSVAIPCAGIVSEACPPASETEPSASGRSMKSTSRTEPTVPTRASKPTTAVVSASEGL